MIIRVQGTKSGDVRFIPINDVLQDELKRLKSEGDQSQYLFLNLETGKPYVKIRKSFLRAYKRAGLEYLRFHDLRHTFASRLVARGVDIVTVQKLLGHSTLSVTQRYTHSCDDRKRNAVELLTPKKRSVGDKMVTKVIAPQLKNASTSLFSVN